MAKTAYPTGTDLDNFLTAQGFTVGSLGTADAVAAACDEFERRTGRRMLQPAADATRRYDPPDDGYLSLAADLSALTSVVYQPEGGGSTSLTQGTDFWLRPCNADQPAEPLLGRPFAQLGGMLLPEWYDAFQPTDADGSLIKREEHPLNVARTRLQPCHRRLFYRALDGRRRGIEGMAFPLVGQCDRHLGAVGIFWEDGG